MWPSWTANRGTLPDLKWLAQDRFHECKKCKTKAFGRLLWLPWTENRTALLGRQSRGGVGNSKELP